MPTALKMSVRLLLQSSPEDFLQKNKPEAKNLLAIKKNWYILKDTQQKRRDGRVVEGATLEMW